MNKRGLTKLLALMLALAMIAAACGGGSDDSTGDDAEATSDTTAGGDDASQGDPADTDEPDEPEDTDTEVAPEEGARTSGGTITVGLEAEATGLRPWEDTCSAPCYNMMVAVFDKLTEQAEDGTYQGYLAESFSSNADFTEWVVTLRPDVVFHNGVEFNAQAVADMFPIQQAGTSAQSVVSASALDGVEATGDLEVTYTLSRSNSAFPAYLSRAQLGLMFEPAAAAADLDGASDAPVGTGPFVIESRDRDNETVFVKNPDYWRSDADGTQLPYLDGITFKPIPDEGSRLDSLLSGTVDAIHSLRQGTIRDARAAKDEGAEVTLLEFQGNNIGGGAYNVAVPPFDDLRVRLGLTQMNSQDKVIEAFGGTGISVAGTQWFSPDSRWYSQKVADAWPEFDFEAGKASVQEYVDDPARSDGKAAGEPIDVELSCPPDPSLIAGMQVIEQTWTASGLVNVNLSNFDQQTHINYAIGFDNGFIGEHGAHCWRFSSESDPSVDINPALAPPTAEVAEAAGLPGVVSPLNIANWFNPEAFGAAAAALGTDDFDERYALYEQIGLLMAAEVPLWFSGHTATMIATADNVHGINGWLLPSGDVGVGFPAAEGRWTEVWVN